MFDGRRHGLRNDRRLHRIARGCIACLLVQALHTRGLLRALCESLANALFDARALRSVGRDLRRLRLCTADLR